MEFSSDIMGGSNILIEQQVGGVSLFINGDAGDIDPGIYYFIIIYKLMIAAGMCDAQITTQMTGAKKMAQAVIAGRAKIVPTDDISLTAYSEFIPFGPTNLNATLQRFDNCTHGIKHYLRV